MAITNTVESALAAAGFNSANWVPEHEPYAHIVTQKRFSLIAMIGNEDLDPKAGFSKTKIKKVPGLIRSEPSSSMHPKIAQYIPLPTEFTANGAVTGLAAGANKSVTLDSTAGLQQYDILRDRATGSEVSASGARAGTPKRRAGCSPVKCESAIGGSLASWFHRSSQRLSTQFSTGARSWCRRFAVNVHGSDWCRETWHRSSPAAGRFWCASRLLTAYSSASCAWTSSRATICRWPIALMYQ